MATIPLTGNGTQRDDEYWERGIAFVVMMAWASILLVAALATPAIEQSSFGTMWDTPSVLLQAVLTVSPAIGPVIAWQWERVGSIVLIVEGIALIVGYPIMVAIGERHGAFQNASGDPLGPADVLLFAALLGLIPLIAGILLWHSRTRLGSPGSAQRSA